MTPANFPLLFPRISVIISKLSGYSPVGRAGALGEYAQPDK